MLFSTRIICCLTVLLIAPALAWAAGPYLKAGGNFSYLPATEFAQPGLEKEASFKSGLGFMAAAGWDFEPLSIEIEGLQLSNSLKKFVNSSGKTTAEGDFTASGILVNGFYHLGPYGYFSPFALLGVGLVTLDLAGIKDGVNDLEDASDSVLAYQLGVGVDAKLTPKLFLEAGYRYFVANSPVFNGTNIDYATHMFWAGLKLNLGTPGR